MTEPDQLSTVLKGRRVLVVEDEMLVAMEIESLLESRGCVVLGPAPTVRQACALIGAERPDAALLDLNLGGESAAPVAEALRVRHVPFVVVSGYGGTQLKVPAIEDALRVEKPFDHQILLRSLAEVIESGPGTPPKRT